MLSRLGDFVLRLGAEARTAFGRGARVALTALKTAAFWHALGSIATVVAAFAAVAAVIVALNDVSETRRASTDQLALLREQLRGEQEDRELFRRQVLGSARPTIIPTVQTISSNLDITITLENVADSPAITGSIALGPPGQYARGEIPPPDEDVSFPVCRGHNGPDPGHISGGSLPSMAARSTFTINLPLKYDSPIACISVVYLDGAGTQWVTDWVIEWVWQDTLSASEPVFQYLLSYPVDEAIDWPENLPQLLWEAPDET